MTFPLYLYPDQKTLLTDGRVPNLDMGIVERISRVIGLKFDVTLFRQLAKLGGELRRLHLLEGVKPQRGLASFGVKGDNVVDKSR